MLGELYCAYIWFVIISIVLSLLPPRAVCTHGVLSSSRPLVVRCGLFVPLVVSFVSLSLVSVLSRRPNSRAGI